MSQAMDLKNLDLASAAFKANPYPTFAQLRLNDPVHLISSQNEQRTWLLTRYQEAELVLRDDRFVKNQRALLPQQEQNEHPSSANDLMNMSMVDFDPPDHTRLRTLVNPFFTPRALEAWWERIQQVTDGLIDTIELQGSADLIEAFAFPLPLTVICEMLGIPVGDRPALHRWTRQLADAFDHPGTMEQAGQTLQTFYSYLLILIEQKRVSPGEDLISYLLQIKNDQISERELVPMIFLLITAGHDPTNSLIGNGIAALLAYPEQLAQLKENPTLIKMAIEESLRYSSPFLLATRRWAREDVELGGKLIGRGDQVAIALSAANRDERAFANPDDLEITRKENHHLSFGKGIHYCLGAPLARMEGQIAIATLLRRLPDLRLQVSPSDLVWRPGSFVIGLSHLPVIF